ncbi:transcription factor TFIIF complex subunit Tfg3 [Coemansia sp. RSA 552]|nr:transcription factor TFIIF complex subunit Tfg3 [Coemansia sp. RSA 552]
MVSQAEVVLAVQTRHEQTGRTALSSGVEYSLRRWSCTVLDGRQRPANAALLPYVRKVEFLLHETFENPRRVVHHAPFRIEEEGWGEFDLIIKIHFVDCAEVFRIEHDLSFHDGDEYEKRYTKIVPNPGSSFLALFNRHTSVSRKTIPARATKARKGPPRDSHYSASQRTSNGSHASHSSGDSDSMSDSQFYSSDDESDSPSSGSKPRSISSISAVSSGRRVDRQRARDTVRSGMVAKRASGTRVRPGLASGKTVVGEHPMSSPTSATDDCYQRPAGSRLHDRPRKDATLAAARRTSSELLTVAKARRSPAEAARPSAGQKAAARSQALNSAGRPAERRVVRDSSISPPIGRSDRPLAPGSAGMKQRQRRLSDLPDQGPKNGARRRTAGPEVVSRASLSKSPPSPHHEPTKRSLAVGISGVKVPKKRTIRAAEDLGDTGRRIKGEKHAAAAVAGWDEPAAGPSKRPRTSDAVAARQAESRRLSSQSPTSTATSSSISPPPSHQVMSSAAVSSREAFIRERERQRHMEPVKDAGAKISARAPRPAGPAPAGLGLGLLGKGAKAGGMAVAKVKVAAHSADAAEDSAADPPRRKVARHDIADISVPKIPRKGATAGAAANAEAPAQNGDGRLHKAPAPTKTKRGRSAEKGNGADGSVLSAELVRKMEHITERASLLDERSVIGFLQLLHNLRVQQEPDSAAAITEKAVDQVETSGAYSCNLSSLAPEAIDRLWAFVRA